MKATTRSARLLCAVALRHDGQMGGLRLSSFVVALLYAVRQETGLPVPCSHASSSKATPLRAASACLIWHLVRHAKRFFRYPATRSSHFPVFASGGTKPGSSGVLVGVDVLVGVGVGVGVAVGV